MTITNSTPNLSTHSVCGKLLPFQSTLVFPVHPASVDKQEMKRTEHLTSLKMQHNAPELSVTGVSRSLCQLSQGKVTPRSHWKTNNSAFPFQLACMFFGVCEEAAVTGENPADVKHGKSPRPGIKLTTFLL